MPHSRPREAPPELAQHAAAAPRARQIAALRRVRLQVEEAQVLVLRLLLPPRRRLGVRGVVVFAARCGPPASDRDEACAADGSKVRTIFHSRRCFLCPGGCCGPSSLPWTAAVAATAATAVVVTHATSASTAVCVVATPGYRMR